MQRVHALFERDNGIIDISHLILINGPKGDLRLTLLREEKICVIRIIKF